MKFPFTREIRRVTGSLRLPYCFPLSFQINWAHWHRDGTNHGVKSRPLVFATTWVRLHDHYPKMLAESWRLWLYFHGGYALILEWRIDKRIPASNFAWPEFVKGPVY